MNVIRFGLIGLLGLALSTSVIADNGLVSLKSAATVQGTADKLVNALEAKGMTIFARIDHSAGAQKAGLDLRPTELVIFGNPKVGTPLMHCSQTIAIDLPQKALVWSDENGQTWFSYNDPAYLAGRHTTKGCDPVLLKVGKVLANFAKAATSP